MTEAYDAIGETGFNSTIVGLLANTVCDQGRYEEAERLRCEEPGALGR